MSSQFAPRPVAMRGAPLPLYPWQAAAIDLVASTGRSLVYTAPTGGGKSRVADELLRRRLDANPRARALVVLPYVALVREKVESLEKALREIKAEVRGYAGTECEGAPLAGRERVAVATIEKASGCVNRMFERGEIENLAVVVVDELHMVSENERGATLEGMLAKIRHAVKSGRLASGGPQIVAMSATVGRESLERLAKWLDAETYVGNSRPVELKEHVVSVDGMFVKRKGGDGESAELSRVGDAPWSSAEIDVIAELVGAVYVRGHSSLIFCISKRQCVTFALALSRMFPPNPQTAGLRETCVEKLYEAAEGEPNIDLVTCARAGLAWHHAGLTAAEKKVIEEGFRNGAILAMTCTTTLAAGVNLPARRCVILRGSIRGVPTPSMAQYKQMAGRAGRKGQSDFGESFLLISNRQHTMWAQNLVCGELPPLESRLFPPMKNPKVSTSQCRFYLESIACGILKTKEDAGELACRTFAWSSGRDNASILACQDSALKEIYEKGLVEARRVDRSAEWCSTPEGFAFYKCTLPIERAKILRVELNQAMVNGLNLSTKTHLLFFCVWPETNPFVMNLNLRVWGDWMSRYPDLYELGEKHLDVTRHFAERAQHRQLVSRESKAKMARHERLAAALLLDDLLRGEDTNVELARKWSALTNDGVDRGKIETLQTAAATAAGMASVLCEQCGWHALAGLLQNASEELQAGARRELLPLMRLEGMTGARARALYSAGFTTPAKIAALSSDKFDKLQEACLKSLSRQKNGLDQALRTTAWRIAMALAKNAKELTVTEARQALNSMEGELDHNQLLALL